MVSVYFAFLISSILCPGSGRRGLAAKTDERMRGTQLTTLVDIEMTGLAAIPSVRV